MPTAPSPLVILPTSERDRPAWKHAGTHFDPSKSVTVSEAINEIAGHLRFDKAPLYLAIGGEMVKTTGEKIIRLPTDDDPRHREIGDVRKGWKLRQYTDYAEALDVLSNEYPVDMVSVYGHGERIYFSLKAPEMTVVGPEGFKDPIQNYFVGEISQEPGRAHQLLYVPVRLRCWNSLSMARRRASIRMNIPHSGDPAERIAFVAAIMKSLTSHMDEGKDLFERMARTTLKRGHLKKIIESAHPYPTVPARVRLIRRLSEDQRKALLDDATKAAQMKSHIAAEEAYEGICARADRFRDGMRELAEQFNDENPAVANTVWSAWQAATEFADWRDSREKDLQTSALFGTRATEKIRAYKACVSILN